MKQLLNTLFLFLIGMSFPFSGLIAQNGTSIIKTVVIDAGHGGKDPGCRGHHTHEKHMTLKLALQFGGMIEAGFPDIDVIYTRTTDVFLPLDERADIANKKNADLFISIHCNAHNSSVSGTETFVMGLHKAKENLAVAKRENSSIYLEEDYEVKYQGFDPESDEGHIWLTMVQNMYLTQSISLANKIEAQFEEVANRKSRGVKQAGFVVLRLTTMPSVLIEAGFLSNRTEEAFINSDNGQYQMAKAMFNAFSEYKYEMDQIAAPELDVQVAPKKRSEPQAEVAIVPPVQKTKPPKNTSAKSVVPEATQTTTTSAGQDVWMAEPLTRP
ncbi:MAG: N-acetylmuramoyl-L-alanine amidase, partial [Bacteroidota bacterium]